MNAHAATPDVTSPVSVLVVSPQISTILFAIRALPAAGFDITAAETFSQAKSSISARPPSLLITEIRLGEYNGLHLVLRGKSAKPDMAAIVTVPTPDVVLQAEAERLGVTFVVTPTSESSLMAAVARTLARTRDAQPVRAPFERRSGERRSVGGNAAAAVERRGHDRRRFFWPASTAANAAR